MKRLIAAGCVLLGASVLMRARQPAAPAGAGPMIIVAGQGTPGFADGPAARALFDSPHAASWGSDGALYAPDIGNRTIRRVRDGRVATVAGIDGQAGSEAARLNRPAAVLVHANWLWIADLDNHRITAVDLKRQQ